ncbi:MAG: carboxyl-terminal protease [Clostridia bacterium]|jgi:carboxyl-terminal processing protease|nr:carboxyl-terminal protease [Clostridia bacterium]
MKKTWKSIIAIVLILSMLSVPVLADGTTSTLLKRLDNLITIIQTYYYKDVKVSDLIDGAIKGMFGALDKHSTYFTPEEYKGFTSNITGEFAGVGIYIEKGEDYIRVISAIKDTPGFRAGILPGDLIVDVDGKDIKGYATEQAAALMKGEAGTKVKIGIRREGVADIIFMDITREIIKINPVEYEILPDNIGFVKITQFNGHVVANLNKAMAEFKAKDVKGLVIDVRNNPGGLLDEVIEVCQQLIPKGPIVSIRYKNKPLETYSSTLAKAPYKIVMLVNEGSASASEIMAAAIKESNTGKLVGTKTYGKGTVQTVLTLTDGSGLKITIANYLTPKGFSLDGVGIMPDFEVQNTTTDAINEYAPINVGKSVKLKDVSLDVLGLQQRLKALGYKVGTLDGVFGKGTLAVVRKFQVDNKLKLDGSMDAEDIKVLNSKFDSLTGSKDAQLDKAVEELKNMLK